MTATNRKSEKTEARRGGREGINPAGRNREGESLREDIFGIVKEIVSVCGGREGGGTL